MSLGAIDSHAVATSSESPQLSETVRVCVQQSSDPAAHALHGTRIPDDRRPKGKEIMSLNSAQNRDFPLLWNKRVDNFAQRSVLASCTASTSSSDGAQTKHRLSK